MSKAKERFDKVRKQIYLAEQSSGRDIGDVTLLAVSKTRPATDLLTAYHLGQRHFGESYLQEALEKQRVLGHCDITWHFIGPIQSNKTRPIAESFNWVHSVDRIKIARRLSEQRPTTLPPLNICLQINISGEESKSGIALKDVLKVSEEIQALPNLKLRGLMAIPAPTDSLEAQRAPYKAMREAVEKQHLPFDTYSMGMSNDMEAAIYEGANIVRVGTALFGPRAKK